MGAKISAAATLVDQGGEPAAMIPVWQIPCNAFRDDRRYRLLWPLRLHAQVWIDVRFALFLCRHCQRDLTSLSLSMYIDSSTCVHSTRGTLGITVILCH